MRLKDKTALITGAGRGIGKAIALGCAKEGAKVIVNYFSFEKGANDVVEEIKKMGSDAIAIKADVSKYDEVLEMVKQSIERFGRIDILVNNAGFLKPSRFEDVTEDVWDATIDINLKGVYNCIKAVVPYMIKQKSGKIVNISSIAAFAGSLTSVPYGAAKAGVTNMTKTLSKELGEHSITINAIAPGPTKTDLLKGLDEKLVEKLKREIPLRRIGEPEDVAKAALFFASSDSDFITGQTLIVDGGRL